MQHPNFRPTVVTVRLNQMKIQSRSSCRILLQCWSLHDFLPLLPVFSVGGFFCLLWGFFLFGFSFPFFFFFVCCLFWARNRIVYMLCKTFLWNYPDASDYPCWVLLKTFWSLMSLTNRFSSEYKNWEDCGWSDLLLKH